MTNIEYQQKAQATSATKTKDEAILNAALGLTGEAGEFADHLKKHLMQGHYLDKDHLVKELGDIMWYVAEACTGLGVTLDEVMTHNINKLSKRYDNGKFEAEKSINREE